MARGAWQVVKLGVNKCNAGYGRYGALNRSGFVYALRPLHNAREGQRRYGVLSKHNSLPLSSRYEFPKRTVARALPKQFHASSEAFQEQGEVKEQSQDDGLEKNSRTTAEQVRHLMRGVPHPVAIITATDPSTFAESSSNSISKSYKGATVSSFNTVTLYPDAVVSFNIKRLSSTFEAIEASGHFNAHLLNENADAEEIATRFAAGNAAAPFENGDGKLANFVLRSQAKKGGDEDIVMSPVIHNHDSKQIVAFRFSCQYLADKTVSIGDHVVVFGRVAGVHPATITTTTTGSEGSTPTPSTCLTYVHGRYSRISDS